MDRQEQVRTLAIRDRGPLLERDEHIRAACHHDLNSRLLLQQARQALGDIQRQLRLREAVALRPGIVATVPGVDDDARHAEPELASQ